MTDKQHTPEPWRWEINAKHKTAQIVGGVPAFDLTVMDFERWGMGGAVPRFRDTAHDRMNIMHRLCDRQDWIAPFQGREHHEDWCANVIHPDARRIVACVNACAGVPIELLEAYPAPFSEMRAERDQLATENAKLHSQIRRMAELDPYEHKLHRQRSKLIKALEEIDTYLDNAPTVRSIARAAIAAVKGEMP